MRVVENQSLDDDTEVVTVALKQSEVNFLMAVLANIGGDPSVTSRRVVFDIRDVLSEYADWDFRPGMWHTTGSIYFLEKK